MPGRARCAAIWRHWRVCTDGTGTQRVFRTTTSCCWGYRQRVLSKRILYLSAKLAGSSGRTFCPVCGDRSCFRDSAVRDLRRRRLRTKIPYLRHFVFFKRAALRTLCCCMASINPPRSYSRTKLYTCLEPSPLAILRLLFRVGCVEYLYFSCSCCFPSCAHRTRDRFTPDHRPRRVAPVCRCWGAMPEAQSSASRKRSGPALWTTGSTAGLRATRSPPGSYIRGHAHSVCHCARRL